MTNSKNILVIGSGTWGTAVANLIAENNHRVFLNSIEDSVINDINLNHKNSKYFPEINLNKNLIAIPNLKTEVDFVFVVVPSHAIYQLFSKISELNFSKECIFVICSKGFEHKNLDLITDAFEKITHRKNYAVLSGPNFAIEVASKVPSITSVASFDPEIAKNVIEILNNDYFKAQFHPDPRTAEICGVVKNILAIGCGIVDGLNLGVNTKSALLVKGVNEIQKLCRVIKANDDLENPAGFGDIFLTCSSTKSRNNSLGLLIARGLKPDPNTTYEGANSAKLIVEFAKKYNLKLDLCEEINKIINGNYSLNEIKQNIITAILS
ncbi:MAG: NAD(P)H-dependent glycerol-3-phosphate dehydrogenase [Rickettsiales bacterium]